jgi:lupus La protein
MWEATDGSSNKPVLIKNIHGFKRMQRFQPYETVVAALRESKFLDVVGEEGEEGIKRKVAYNPTISRSKVDARSVYVKGFGEEEPSSQFDIEAFFTQFGTTNAVRLRRTDDRLFKGSVFVEFQDEETAEAFLKLDPKPLWKGKHELEISSKNAYKDKKDQEIKDGITKPKESWGPRGGRGGFRSRGQGRGSYDRNGRGNRDDRGRGRGDRDPDDWKKRREEDRASGFKDPRGHRKDNNRDRDHKGGRGRGRRDDRGPGDNDRKRSRDDAEDDAPASKKVDSKSEGAAAPEPAKNDKKRAREEDDEGAGGPAKVDSKSEVPVEAS